MQAAKSGYLEYNKKLLNCLEMFTSSVFLKHFFFCSNALIALARSLCKCLLAQLITASGANAVKGYLVRCACIDGTIP